MHHVICIERSTGRVVEVLPFHPHAKGYCENMNNPFGGTPGNYWFVLPDGHKFPTVGDIFSI